MPTRQRTERPGRRAGAAAALGLRWGGGVERPLVLLQPCKTTAAFEAIPDSDLRLDLEAVEQRLHAAGWRTLANAGVMLVIRRGTDDASVFKSGKLLIKTRDATVAQRVWTEISPHYGAMHGR